MCNDHTDADLDHLTISRRELGVLVGSVGVSITVPSYAAGMDIAEQDVSIPMPDGTADAFFVSPAKGRHPAVLIWADIYGLRPAYRDMARRLAGAGYAVLVPNPFYRSMKAPVIGPDDLKDAATRERIMPMRKLLTPDAIIRDARTYIAWLDARKTVDDRRKAAVTGYCMGGALAIRSASAVPERLGAVASFHGGALVTDAPDSAHLSIPATKARYLIAIADNDDKQKPDDKDLLRSAFVAAGHDAEIEVYAGAMHGWCTPDSRAYDAERADRAWKRMLILFEKALI
jgi:carboxymethylenebutenolidase